MTRRTLVPAAALVAVLAGCGDDGGTISSDPEDLEEPGDNPEGAPDGGVGDDDPTESEQEGRLEPGDPET